MCKEATGWNMHFNCGSPKTGLKALSSLRFKHDRFSIEKTQVEVLNGGYTDLPEASAGTRLWSKAGLVYSESPDSYSSPGTVQLAVATKLHSQYETVHHRSALDLLGFEVRHCSDRNWTHDLSRLGFKTWNLTLDGISFSCFYGPSIAASHVVDAILDQLDDRNPISTVNRSAITDHRNSNDISKLFALCANEWGYQK
eukprot:GHVH01007585.1.p2 GENE.GHVH01007585.1~~GHVH01007585.1.p2  ORF type:complete len:198 (+),score=18.25 GHVH01007585.1:9-602(+)